MGWIGRDLERRLESGWGHFERGEFGAAAEFFESAARQRDCGRASFRDRALNLAGEARLQLGLALHHAARDAQAETELGRALALRPEHARARYARARIYHRSGRIPEAVGDLERAITERPRESDYHLLLASCATQWGEERLANQALRHATELMLGGPCAPVAAGPGTETPARRPPGQAGRKSGPRALDPGGPVEDAVRANPSYPDLRFRLALQRLAENRADAAEVELERALRINPKYVEARVLSARLQLDRGAGRPAIRHLEEATASHPHYPDLHFWLGFAWFRAAENARAARSLGIAIELNREFARAQRLLGVVQFRMGNGERALRSVRRGFLRDREIGTVAPHVAAPLPSDAPRAESQLRRAVVLQPDYPDLHLALACARRADGDLDRAAEGCRVALGLQPRYSTAAMELARIELARGRHQDAATLLSGLVERHPRWADVHALLGRAFRLGGEPSAAQPPLRIALWLNPAYSQAREDLAWALQATVPTRKKGTVSA